MADDKNGKGNASEADASQLTGKFQIRDMKSGDTRETTLIKGREVRLTK